MCLYKILVALIAKKNKKDRDCNYHISIKRNGNPPVAQGTPKGYLILPFVCKNALLESLHYFDPIFSKSNEACGCCTLSVD